MSQDDNQGARFTLLSDQPVVDDKFGSHARVAESIADRVESDADGMMIGLEGTWGSGKSSIIKMLEKRWQKREEIQVFTFDAWAHEGDPLRRSFLEELTSFLGHDGHSWISGDGWQKRIDRLTKRVQETSTESSPLITVWTVLFSISWLVVPIGFGALRFLGHEKGLDWLARFGLLVFSPLALFLIAASWVFAWSKLSKRFCRAMQQGKTWSRLLDSFLRKRSPRLLQMLREMPDGKSRLPHFAGLFLRKHTTRTQSATSQGIDPTSVEFQREYERILAEVFGTSGRRLVIVVDNLDRVGPPDAKKIWATMKRFVESAGAITSEGLWVIVPYDPDAIDQLWRDGKDDGFPREFKEKTFQVRYRVALPLDSRWEEFFKSGLEIALGGVSEDDRHAVCAIFRYQALPTYREEGTPTPREMKVFSFW